MTLVYTSWHYIDFLKSKRDTLESSKHKTQALSMQEKVSSMILQKQKSTVAMALSMARNEDLTFDVKHKNISPNYYKELISKFNENTLYKNIWIQILDKDINSLYRSWTDKKGDNLSTIRLDLVNVAKTKKVACSVSVGRFNLTIKAIVPLFIDKKFIGIIEVISHFNSISRELKKSKIDSIVVLKKEFKNQLKYPFTKIFIDDYYVANFDAPKDSMNYLKENGIEKYFNNSYKLENTQIIASHELKNKDEKPVGYYIMFKKTDTISNMDLDFFMFKWLTLGIIIIMSIAIIISTILFFSIRRQKQYYKNIIGSTTNIVLINDKKFILDVNDTFFKYFTQYHSLEEFKEKHNCICDYFVQEEGYIQSIMDDKGWVEYLLENRSNVNIAKMNISGRIYYFYITASKVQKEQNHNSIVLTDITKQENYKKELEHLTITDALTGIGNRRFFQKKIKEEIKRVKRYKHSLSLIMVDIDFFKLVNDEHGHGVGDEVLVEYSKLILSSLREGDIFCRIGGEEFMIILPHATKDEALKIAEKLRVKVQESKKVVPITMSFGVVEYVLGEDTEHVFKRVDAALYKAKDSGRNIVIYG